MSFDIYFLAGDRPFAESMEAMEQAALSDPVQVLDDGEIAHWDTITDAIAELWSGSELMEKPSFRQLSCPERAAQLTLSPGELSLTIAYWHTHTEADEVETWLRDVVTSIEEVSGLVGYDPQSDTRFLDTDPGSAAHIMNNIAARLDDILRPGT
jgi:hypothetical protein